MALLCGGNALLWWGWGPATGRGLATNSEAFIAGVLPIYSFMTLPLFTAVIMADPIIRDFRAEIGPLIFSKPVGRAIYLLGKFFGSFFVLACGQAAFVVMLFVLQWFSRPGVTQQGLMVVPYFKHFVVFVVMSHLVLAAIYFAVGTLTRNAKIVYALGVCFYPLIISYNIFFLNGLPSRWQRILDPLVMRWGQKRGDVHTLSAEACNRLVVTYDAELIINRAVMLLIAAGILTLVYRRFIIAEPPQKIHFSFLNLSTASERISFEPVINWDEQDHEARRAPLALPSVNVDSTGLRASFRKLIAALAIEFRLLLAERSIVVIIPLAVLLSTMEVIFWRVRPDGSSASYVFNIAGNSLLFMIGISIFYIGEALQRDRDLKIESLVWSQPISNSVLLISKFLATLLLVCILLMSVGLIAVLAQIIKGDRPLEITAYLRVYFWILMPNAVFLSAAATFLKVLLRDRYLTYIVAIGIGVGLFYMYSQGHNGWLYNPLLFRLWRYEDLLSGNNLSQIAQHRVYIVTIALALIALAHFFYQRRSTRRRVL
jgi:ABC-type transport system involved in multi-copper enzyme maturation permease subunit